MVFIVDDDNELCHSLQWLLESIGLSVQTFSNGPDFLSAFNTNQPGCILIDIRMPIMSGLELQDELNTRRNIMPIIFMTGHGDIPMAVRAMKAGAFDFFTKPFNDQLALERIQKAIAYHQKIMAGNQHHADANARLKLLTMREREVLQLILEGKLNKEMAHELGISIKTIELHRANVMHKMQAATVAELVKLYLAAENSVKALQQ